VVVGFTALSFLALAIAPPASARATYSLEKLRAMVGDKTRNQVIAMLGKPDRVSGKDHDSWVYQDIIEQPYSDERCGLFIGFIALYKGREPQASMISNLCN
jgi:hypothetical protein